MVGGVVPNHGKAMLVKEFELNSIDYDPQVQYFHLCCEGFPLGVRKSGWCIRSGNLQMAGSVT